jgi:hypothetical protein
MSLLPGAFLEELLQFGRAEAEEGAGGRDGARVRVEAVRGRLLDATFQINRLHCLLALGAGCCCVLLLRRVRQRAQRQRFLLQVQRLRQRQRASLRCSHRLDASAEIRDRNSHLAGRTTKPDHFVIAISWARATC